MRRTDMENHLRRPAALGRKMLSLVALGLLWVPGSAWAAEEKDKESAKDIFKQ